MVLSILPGVHDDKASRICFDRPICTICLETRYYLQTRNTLQYVIVRVGCTEFFIFCSITEAIVLTSYCMHVFYSKVDLYNQHTASMPKLELAYS